MVTSTVAGVSDHPIQILLVDDHPMMRAGIKMLFANEPDLKVIGEAGDGRTAIRMASELVPNLVLMDASLPELGGAEATRRIVAAAPRPKILALSVHEDPAFARVFLQSGASGYLLKRSAAEELLRAVRAVAAGNPYVDPIIASQLVPRNSRVNLSGISRASLSVREAEVIKLLANGYTAKEVALKLTLSTRTLETYRARAMSKLHLRTRAELIRYAMESGWLHDA